MFGRGGVELKDSDSTVSVEGQYIDHAKRGTSEGSLTFSLDLKGAVIAEAGAYASWRVLFAGKRYEYVFGKWEMGEIGYKRDVALNVAEGTGWRPPELSTAFKANDEDEIPFRKTVTDESTPLLAGSKRSDDA